MENLNTINTNYPSSGMMKDYDSFLLKEDVVTHARNATTFSKDGMSGFYQDEPATIECVEFPYPMIGKCKLPDGTFFVFLTDDINSEVGIFNELNCSYQIVKNAQWLNFNRSSLITAKSKENSDCTYSVYWADGRRNPDRRLTIQKSDTETYDSIRLAKIIDSPYMTLKKSNSGSLENGKYEAVLFYSINGQRFGNAYSLTLGESIFNDNNFTGGLEIKIDNLDNDFIEYQLVIIQTSNNTTTAKVVGTFPSKARDIYISNFSDPSYQFIDLSEIVKFNPVWVASDQINGNNQLLFRVGTETIPELNYQLQALDIVPEYVVIQVPEDYYLYNDNVGHFRDEVYRYELQWYHKLGFFSSGFHLEGRPPMSDDLLLASGNDVYEGLIDNCIDPPKLPRWKIYNTAQFMVPSGNVRKDNCDELEIGHGQMAYWESTDLLPDNKIQFGDRANTPIRDPKFPDEEKCPRYTSIDGVNYINILAIRFSNISHPKKMDGSLDTDWIGYRIIRADRQGNRSVISRGMLTNVRSYTDNQNKEEIFYTNYPVNDLSPDVYLSSTQTTFKNHGEQDYSPLTTVHYDKFNYYSPNSKIDRATIGETLKIESEEIADISGSFEPTYGHPRQRLLSLFSFWVSAAMGAVQALITTLGTSNAHGGSEMDYTVTGGQKRSFSKDYKIETAEDLIGLDIASMIADAVAAVNVSAIWTAIKDIILVVASLGLKALMFTFIGIQYANTILDAIYKFLDNIQYAYQYNSHAIFNKSVPVETGYKRRFVKNYRYTGDGLFTIKDGVYNNYGKQESVYIELNQALSQFKNKDNSRNTISGFGIQEDITRNVNSQGVAFYATSKREISNQYSRIESVSNYLITHNNYFAAIPENTNTVYETPVIYGGDCYINKYSFLSKTSFFTQNQGYPIGTPDGTGYDYRQYRNIAYPRFWADFFSYDFSSLISSDVINFTTFSRTVTSKHNLDNKGADKENIFRIDNAYFYTSCNSAIEFFVESEYNLAFREQPKDDNYFYSDKFSSLPEIFRNDRLRNKEIVTYDRSFSKQANEIYAVQQASDYDPTIYNSCYKYDRNRLIYSLPSYQEQKFDNWIYFLANNTYSFPKSEFGDFVSMTRVQGQRIMFLFDRSSPYITLGNQELKMTNLTITIGDGGLFAQPPQEILYTENAFGNSQSRLGVISSSLGTFYISERQGRLFKFDSSLDEVTRNGFYIWSKRYFPVKLIERFPEYPHGDNPLIGVGYQTAFDASHDIIYISKKDYYPISQYINDIIYDIKTDKFYYKDIPIELTDTNYFDNLSFTLSYSLSAFDGKGGFISFHDWIPDAIINGEKSFFTLKGTKLWKHNNSCQSFCNYYGVQYPFEIEFAVSNKFQVKTLSNIEYYLECYKYLPDCINKGHVIDGNFDRMMVYNSEQFSGMYNLVKPPSSPYERIKYPKRNGNSFDVLSTKTENKYRVNQIRDITKNRQDNRHIFFNMPNGYIKVINPEYLDLNKDKRERKLFRHYDNRVWLAKDNPGDLKMIFKLNLTKQIVSPR